MSSDEPNNRGQFVPLAVLLTVILLAALFLQQSFRYHQLARTTAAAAAKKTAMIEKHKVLSKTEELFNDRSAKLQVFEKNLPQADGYVWVSKILHEAVPKLNLTIDPPESGEQELLSTTEYCTGIFRVRGSGTVADFFSLLAKIESNMPFARIQEMQFGFSANEEKQVDFSFTLLAVLRLADDWEKPMQTAHNLLE